jgi:hypothetical protein
MSKNATLRQAGWEGFVLRRRQPVKKLQIQAVKPL